LITFPIKKRINTELFVERTAAFYKGVAGIRVKINEVDSLSWSLLIGGASLPCAEALS